MLPGTPMSICSRCYQDPREPQWKAVAETTQTDTSDRDLVLVMERGGSQLQEAEAATDAMNKSHPESALAAIRS